MRFSTKMKIPIFLGVLSLALATPVSYRPGSIAESPDKAPAAFGLFAGEHTEDVKDLADAVARYTGVHVEHDAEYIQSTSCRKNTEYCICGASVSIYIGMLSSFRVYYTQPGHVPNLHNPVLGVSDGHVDVTVGYKFEQGTLTLTGSASKLAGTYTVLTPKNSVALEQVVVKSCCPSTASLRFPDYALEQTEICAPPAAQLDSFGFYLPVPPKARAATLFRAGLHAIDNHLPRRRIFTLRPDGLEIERGEYNQHTGVYKPLTNPVGHWIFVTDAHSTDRVFKIMDCKSNEH